MNWGSVDTSEKNKRNMKKKRKQTLLTQKTLRLSIDIYTPHSRGLEVFVKTDFQNRGKDLGGIIWEEDPVRHRDIAKKISPAFSARAIRSMEGVVCEYFDFFVEKMKDVGSLPEGVPLVDWTNWVASDLATDLTWSEQVNEMRDSMLPLHPFNCPETPFLYSWPTLSEKLTIS